MAIDDEPLALNIIEDYIGNVDFLELIGKYTLPLEAFNLLRSRKVDILFLDIQMPELSGFELLESLSNPPKVIFTTAYENYALDSYNFKAVDYLLKPFSFARFLKAIDKAVESTVTSVEFAATTQEKLAGNDFIFINHDGAVTRLLLTDIEYFKGMGDYVQIRTLKKNYLIKENLKKIEEALVNKNFVRIHKSYIVPLGKIESIESNTIKISDTIIPIGGTYKTILMSLINSIKFG